MMRSVLVAILLSVSGIATAQLPADAYRITPTKDAKAPLGVYIPTDLDDTFVELKKMLSPAMLHDFRIGPEKEMLNHHDGLGRWIRNNWMLWQGSRLSKHFNDLGIDHPEDMSVIILDSFWRHLNDRPIDVAGQVAYYQAYWAKVRREQPQRGR